MPRGEQIKEPAFQMWLHGIPLPEIQKTTCGRSKALLRRLRTDLEQYSNYYFLWLIAARIALWTREPVELNQAHEMTDKSLKESSCLIRTHCLEGF